MASNPKADDSGSQQAHPSEEAPYTTEDGGTVVQRFYTKDGTPVEPSTLLPKDTTGRRPDVGSRPDVVEKAVHVKEDGTVMDDQATS